MFIQNSLKEGLQDLIEINDNHSSYTVVEDEWANTRMRAHSPFDHPSLVHVSCAFIMILQTISFCCNSSKQE